MLTAPCEEIQGQLAYAADDATSVLASDWLETARLRPSRHAARVYKAVFRTVFTADLRRSPRVIQRWFDSNLPLLSTPKTNQTRYLPEVSIHSRSPLPSLSVMARVCAPTATDSYRALRVETRQFDSNLPLHSKNESNTIPPRGIYPVTIQSRSRLSETATVCVPTATVT